MWAQHLGLCVAVETSPILNPVLVKVTVNAAERMYLEHLARQAGMSVQDYFRVHVGLRRRPMGRPTADQIADAEDDVWNLLRQIGVDPAPYFPDEPPQPPSEDQETPAEREARIARLRAVIGNTNEHAR